MATFDLVIRPSSVRMVLQGNTGLFVSGLNGVIQTIDRGGLRWDAQLNWNNKKGFPRAELMALIAELRGQSNRVRVPVSDNPARGAYGGTPLVAGASQTGSAIAIDGCTPSVTNWIRRGDYFSIDVNGEQELKLCTADANSDGGGALTIQFEPRLRASPADNAAVRVQDGVLDRPEGVFILSSADNGWDSRPGADDKIGAFSLGFIEDVFATQ